ncbi:MAG: type III pantothenate kinase [Bdellovibrionales bacterium]|nr:type III pantothenate kinase [Bdellovibrionales bacterium]
MKFFAIDVGNSNTKIAFFHNQRKVFSKQLPTSTSNETNSILLEYQNTIATENILFNEYPIFISSVVLHITKALQSVKNIHFISSKSPINFTILRIDPSTLGADIIAASQAALNLYQTPCIVVDAGTATTITMINKNREFIGGTISPGLGISAKALSLMTSQLPTVELIAPTKTIGFDTETAIQSGLIHGHVGMIESLVQKFMKEEGISQASIVLTGGAICKLIELLPSHYIYNSELVIEGIASLAEQTLALSPDFLQHADNNIKNNFRI